MSAATAALGSPEALAPPEPDADDAAAMAWGDACLAAMLIAMAPPVFGGAAVRAHAGPVRDAWLEELRAVLPPSAPFRKMPAHIADERLLGGLDMAATLRTGKPVVQRGLLAEADGGVVVVPMAERLEPFTASRLTASLDTREVALERDGLTSRLPARIGVVALDEGLAEDETVSAALADRLAFHLDLTTLTVRDIAPIPVSAEDVAAASARFAALEPDDAALETMTALAAAFGVSSIRAVVFALRAACCLAALDGRDAIGEDDISTAARLVIAPRATMMPAIDPEPEQDRDEPEQDQQDPHDTPGNEDDSPPPDGPMDDVVLDAVAAAIPADLLTRLKAGDAMRGRAQASVGAGQRQKARMRGRPIGARPGKLDGRNRLHVVETLRTAAPWQRLRGAGTDVSFGSRKLAIRAEDIRVRRFKQRQETVTIFAVDASGSAALHRLAEAKGAVELLLADCYARRDQVALIAFRGSEAELVLPPTRSLVRAKRCLAGVPGGGGTPLAAGIDAAAMLAEEVRRKGRSAQIVLLTDGSANIGYDPKAGRGAARDDALEAAKRLRVAGLPAILVDTSPRGNPKAEELAQAMDAPYLALPQADSARLRNAVTLTAGAGSGPAARAAR